MLTSQPNFTRRELRHVSQIVLISIANTDCYLAVDLDKPSTMLTMGSIIHGCTALIQTYIASLYPNESLGVVIDRNEECYFIDQQSRFIPDFYENPESASITLTHEWTDTKQRTHTIPLTLRRIDMIRPTWSAS